MSTRRKFLKVLGGGVIVAAAGGGAFLATRTPTKALAPWEGAAGYDEPVKRALAHALLAPNPHNRQPWLVDLSVENQVTVLRDETRELPMTDPFNRQIFIGMGCFLENMVIAASQTGHAVELDILPEGESGPVAVARFSQGESEDPLARQILHRHSAKENYTEAPVEPEKAEALSAYVRVITRPDEVQALRELTWKALEVEITTERTLQESIDLSRIGKREINASPDGIEMREPHLDALYSLGLLTREMMADTSGAAMRGVLDRLKTACFATPAHTVLVTDGNTRRDQIEAGRVWMRYSLAVTGLGLGTQPMSQALQEFPEMSEHYAQAHATLAKPGQTVQMLARLGYGSAAIPTPRWPLETRIMNG